MESFDLPICGSTHCEKKAKRSWEKSLKKIKRFSGLSVENTFGKYVVFGRQVMRSNTKKALVGTIEVPKSFLNQMILMQEDYEAQIEDLKNFEFEEIED